jgi:hypothetical protein
LTFIGGGVFGNPAEVIAEGFTRAFHAFIFTALEMNRMAELQSMKIYFACYDSKSMKPLIQAIQEDVERNTITTDGLSLSRTPKNDKFWQLSDMDPKDFKVRQTRLQKYS